MCIVVLNKVVIGKYYDTNSLIHNMNPILKIICTLLFTVFSFFSFDLYFNLIILFLLAILLLLSNVPMKNYFKSICGIKWLVLFIFVINLIFEKNIYIAFILASRIVLILLYSMMILYTTKNDEIIYGLQRVFGFLRIFKIPVSKMAFSIGLALRFIPDLLLSINRVLKSYSNKGIYFDSLKLKDKFDLLKNMINSVFVLSIKRADLLSDSMEVRLYDVNNYKVNNKYFINYFDIFIFLIHLVLLILIIRNEVFI